MKVESSIRAEDLAGPLRRVLELAAAKVAALDKRWKPADGAPVFTVDGKYTSRAWTQWTEGFAYGCALLAFDGTDDEALLKLGRRRTLDRMLPHVTHRGVHDHGFNTISSYGNLHRLIREGRAEGDDSLLETLRTAICASAAVQAMRWSPAGKEGEANHSAGESSEKSRMKNGVGYRLDGGGYIYSFNGPHSLFIDTLRTLRVLGLGHQLGHVLMDEHDAVISLLGRLVRHGLTSARYNVYYGRGRDVYDTPDQRGRTVHEAIFNRNDGRFRCPSSQQGYSPFTTWTRGLAWAMLGFAEQLEFLAKVDAAQFKAADLPARPRVLAAFRVAARATCDHYIAQASTRDGLCYWDTGAPGLTQLGDWRGRDANPFNDHEPVDASAAAIAAQGLLRLGHHLGGRGGRHYVQAGLTVARTLFDEPYLSTRSRHEGLLLHSVYHRPNGWDHIPRGRKTPCGEACMWGDYHLLELAVYIQRMQKPGGYLTFFDAIPLRRTRSAARPKARKDAT
jgi:unsaturated chondroitin disaccharide hydrolase